MKQPDAVTVTVVADMALNMFAALPLALNVALFIAVAGAVWSAGTRLAAYADSLETNDLAGTEGVARLLDEGCDTVSDQYSTWPGLEHQGHKHQNWCV